MLSRFFAFCKRAGVPLALVVVGGLLLARLAAHEPLNDPDRYYHLAISKIYAHNLVVDKLPQAEDLGWGEFFIEKEYFFHVFTGVASRLGGDDAVALAVQGLGLLSLVALFLLTQRRTGPWTALGIVAVLTVMTERFWFRLELLRPHVLAILLFVLILEAGLRRSGRALFVLCFLFAMSYYGAYGPLTVLGCLAVAGATTGTAWRRPCAMGVSGIVVGTVLNPAFPGNIEALGMVVRIALAQTKAKDIGVELYPFTTVDYLKHVPLFPLLLLGSWILITKGLTETRRGDALKLLKNSCIPVTSGKNVSQLKAEIH